ncbi:rna-directed dna polymerase from mobile element jockey-like [Willisornis vidua]|uniref:Rna-directed dna polymerase from mobile element jockey-like n=1 Tax=Willisornis vidua TaxID=1566151 RepID=A0ABQ9DQU3_9PASS|nr:rna-directed dna polymerase from mobile element jockey-like [Willisornis vidua]
MPDKIMEQILLETVLRYTENKEVFGDRRHCITKGKSYLKKMVAFYDRVTELKEKGRATDIIYLDLCKALDTVLHDILVFKLESHGFDRWTTWWTRNWLDDCTHSKGYGQWLNFQVGASDKWCSLGGDTAIDTV